MMTPKNQNNLGRIKRNGYVEFYKSRTYSHTPERKNS